MPIMIGASPLTEQRPSASSASEPSASLRKYAKARRSSAGVAVFVSQEDGHSTQTADWIEVGRCYERFALQAAALGIRNAFLIQPVEVEALRPQFATYLGLGNRRPD